jgi:hypothetical protein
MPDILPALDMTPAFGLPAGPADSSPAPVTRRPARLSFDTHHLGFERATKPFLVPPPVSGAAWSGSGAHSKPDPSYWDHDAAQHQGGHRCSSTSINPPFSAPGGGHVVGFHLPGYWTLRWPYNAGCQPTELPHQWHRVNPPCKGQPLSVSISNKLQFISPPGGRLLILGSFMRSKETLQIQTSASRSKLL